MALPHLFHCEFFKQSNNLGEHPLRKGFMDITEKKATDSNNGKRNFKMGRKSVRKNTK
jgi:hypothetical protein